MEPNRKEFDLLSVAVIRLDGREDQNFGRILIWMGSNPELLTGEYLCPIPSDK